MASKSQRQDSRPRKACFNQTKLPQFCIIVICGKKIPGTAIITCLPFVLVCLGSSHGEVSERFKEHAWKACVGETRPWVRIPPSPPSLFPFPLVLTPCDEAFSRRKGPEMASVSSVAKPRAFKNSGTRQLAYSYATISAPQSIRTAV